MFLTGHAARSGRNLGGYGFEHQVSCSLSLSGEFVLSKRHADVFALLGKLLLGDGFVRNKLPFSSST